MRKNKPASPVVPEAAIQTKLLISLLISLFIVVSGTLWTWRVGQTSNKLAHELFHLSEDVKGMRNAVAKAKVEHK